MPSIPTPDAFLLQVLVWLGALASIVILLLARLSGWVALQVPLYIVWVPLFLAGTVLGAITAFVVE
jgi:hypothetical protein